MKIFWTESALNELNAVFEYYQEKASIEVARRIKKSAIARVKILKKQPLSGQLEEYLKELGLDHRYLVVGNYKIVYRVVVKNIFITDFFDTRQDPKKLISKDR